MAVQHTQSRSTTNQIIIRIRHKELEINQPPAWAKRDARTGVDGEIAGGGGEDFLLDTLLCLADAHDSFQ